VDKQKRLVSELKGLDAPVRAFSTVIVARWGLEALADITRKEDQIPPNYEVLVAVKNSYQECTGWLIVIGLFVLATLLFVQKRKDFKQ
jgi:hypothetical protein